MATVQEESVHADTGAEGEEESKDIGGGVHAGGASPGTGEYDGDERHGQDLPSSIHEVDNPQVFGHGWLCHPTSPRGRFSENFNSSTGFVIQEVKVQKLIHFYDSLNQ